MHKPQLVIDTIFKHTDKAIEGVPSIETRSHFVLRKRAMSSKRTHNLVLNIRYDRSLVCARAFLSFLDLDGKPVLQTKNDRQHHVLVGVTSVLFNAEGDDQYSAPLDFGFDVQSATSGVLYLTVEYEGRLLASWHTNVIRLNENEVQYTDEPGIIQDNDDNQRECENVACHLEECENQYAILLHKHDVLVKTYSLLYKSYNQLYKYMMAKTDDTAVSHMGWNIPWTLHTSKRIV